MKYSDHYNTKTLCATEQVLSALDRLSKVNLQADEPLDSGNIARIYRDTEKLKKQIKAKIYIVPGQ